MTSRMCTAVGIVLAVAVVCLALDLQNFNLLILLPTIPLLAMLTGHLRWLLVLMLASQWSDLQVPGIMSGLKLYHLLAFMVVAVMIAQRGLLMGEARRVALSRIPIWAFLLVVIVTVSFRGVGVRFLGGDLEGGVRYISTIIACFLLLFSPSLSLTERQWRISMVGMIVLAVIPFLAQLAFVVSGGRMIAQFYYIGTSNAMLEMTSTLQQDAATRFSILSSLGKLYLIPFLLDLNYRRHFVRSTVICFTGIAVTVLAGFRGSVLGVIFFLWVFLLLEARVKWRYLLLSAACFPMVIFLVAHFAYVLPFGAQRALSVIPGANISIEARIAAVGTTDWRIDLWKEGLRQFPRYVWLGKGFAYNSAESLEAMRPSYGLPYDPIKWAVVQADYHQGLLSMVILLGVFGAAFFLWIMVKEIRANTRFTRTAEINSISRYHRVLSVLFLLEFIYFITIGGQAHVNIPSLLFQAALLQMLRNSYVVKSEPVHEKGPPVAVTST